MQFQTFDEEYVGRLRDGDAGAEEHFAAYFGELIHLKLRRRVRTPQLVEDIRQETLCRVLRILREKGGIEDARKLGAFVSAVCHYVTAEAHPVGKLDTRPRRRTSKNARIQATTWMLR